MIPRMRRQNHYDYETRGGITFGVQWLLILNISIFVLEESFGLRLKPFGELHANWWRYLGFWQLITYQFLHQGFGHLLANMLGLFFLGPETERALGTNRFFSLYLLSGILGGLGWSFLSPDHLTCVGASGSVFGILGAYAAFYPQRKLYIYGLLPIKAWVLILCLGIYELIRTFGGPGGTVANAAHLGGGIAGYVYATIIGRPEIMRKIRRKFEGAPATPVDRKEIDRILDKASAEGLHRLTASERALLKRAGKDSKH